MSNKREHTFADSIEEVRRVSEERARAEYEREREGRVGPIRDACLSGIIAACLRGELRFMDIRAGLLRYRLGEREYTITVTVEDA